MNAARAYHYFQQYLASDWMEDRTPSLASSAASEESAKESPVIERADRVSEAGMDEDEDVEHHRSERVKLISNFTLHAAPPQPAGFVSFVIIPIVWVAC
eukprot:gene4360-4613_t